MSKTRSSAKTDIEKLVRYFEQNIHQLKAQSFNEAQARQSLIDPFFEAIGWDVRNRNLEPPFRLEVLPEGRVKTSLRKDGPRLPSSHPRGGQELNVPTTAIGEEMASMLEYIADDEYKAEQKMATKKPDYRFRIQGSTKFFVEAKKPFVDLMTNLDAIFQIKRYGFSARVPVSILTDFEEFRVFDCTRRPFYDKPQVGVLKEFDLSYKTYLDEFDKLYDTFSRDAVVGGSIEMVQKKYLEKKKGEFALDRSFLDDLSDWRVELAQDIAKHPKNRRILTTDTLNECVQRILDRIVFLRVCEDRNIDPEQELLALLRLWETHPGLSLYEMFVKLIEKKRPLYNGLLFAEHESEQLEVGNKILEKIFKNINYPLSPYTFNEIGVEILGSIYERFLGKTIRLTQKQVRIEEKPEVRKAGGVYYTPQYIVNYIVENTVGRLLYDLTPSSGHPSPIGRGDGRRLDSSRGEVQKLKLNPRQIAKLKIIDIACGSGSFLLGAFQKLIDYHEQYYTQHPDEIKEAHGVRDAYEDAQGRLVLSARKKREILVNNIYGVDIDPQAVEVTQMSLYLKVLEDENDATLNKPTMLALHDVLLPPLKNNIKCGNSLIGTDIGAQGDLFNADATRKINPFDWQTEFKEILDAGGFDCVIGNPPYVRIQSLPPEQVEYLSSQYVSATGNADLYVSFIERGYLTLKKSGRFGMIVPNKFFKTDYGKGLRTLLSEAGAVTRIVDFGHSQVFEATTYTCLLFLSKQTNNQFVYLQAEASHETLFGASSESLNSTSLSSDGWLFSSRSEDSIIEKLQSRSVKLLDLPTEMSRGSSTGADDVFMVEQSTRKLEKDILRKPVFATDFSRYTFHPTNSWLVIFPYRLEDGRYRLTTEQELKKQFPKTHAYLKQNQALLQKRKQYSEWFGYSAPRNLELHDRAQIFVPLLANHGSFALIPSEDSQKLCPMASGGFTIMLDSKSKLDPKYLLGLLNSTLIFWKLRKTSNVFRGGWITCTKQYFGELPIRTIDFTKPEEKKMHDDLVALVEKMLDLHKQLNKASFDSEKEPIQRQIEATDKKIDELVYELYGITEEERSIIEGSA